MTLETTLARLSVSNARQRKLLDKSGTHMFQILSFHQIRNLSHTDTYVFFLVSPYFASSWQQFGGGGGEKESRESCPGCQLRHFQVKFVFENDDIFENFFRLCVRKPLRPRPRLLCK